MSPAGRTRQGSASAKAATDSVKSAATDLAKTIIDLYNGNLPGNPIGTFGEHYYWWTGGVVWESMIDYWSLTGDSSYNNLVGQALAAQVGSKLDYMPANQTKDEVRSLLSCRPSVESA